MLSFGIIPAARFDGKTLEPFDLDDEGFYAELRPISDKYDPDALKVARLDRRKLELEGEPPNKAMDRAAAWVRQTAGEEANPVAVAYPLGFDWLFLYWYLVSFAASGSPFGFSSALDMKTIYQQKANVIVGEAGRDDLPPDLRSSREHTHNALDDAREQAEIFVKLFRWDPAGV